MTDKPGYKISDKRGEVKPQKAYVPEVKEEVDKIPDAPNYKELNVEMNDDRVLFQDFPMADKVGTLFIPQVGDVGVNKARVVAIGNNVKMAKVGDIVYKIAELGEYLMTNQGQFRFLPEDAIIAFDRKFDGKSTPVMKLDQAGV
jgi:hypothetical protein